MKIVVDVIAAEQSWSFDTKRQEHFLVIEVFGVRTRVPCTETELVHAIVEAEGGQMAPPDEAIPFSEPMAEDEPRAAPVTFVDDVEVAKDLSEMLGTAVQVRPAPSSNGAAERQLAPLKRSRGDDVGIAQG